ncbi:hypothetical protein SNE40_010587 [Patella caerulea]|uniref:Uncharacterized protein n=1 Tax=Patella caerulea TaxID=87958 RepID=A0AAN8JWB5_PATCE
MRREKRSRQSAIYFDNEVDITDELGGPMTVRASRAQQPRSSIESMESEISDRILEMDITDIDVNGSPKMVKSSRRVSTAISKVYIKKVESTPQVIKEQDSEDCRSNSSESSASTTSTQSSPTLPRSRSNLLHMIERADSIVESLVDQIEFNDCDSIWDEREDSKFHVKFFNRYGRKGKDDEELQNATNVSHVYKDVTLVTDMLNNKVLLYGRSGRPRKSFVAEECSEPWAATITPRGYVAVTLRRKKYVALWSACGEEIAQIGKDELKCPTGIAVDKRGRYIVTDEELNDVFLYSPGGHCVRSLGGGFKQPRFVCVANSGKILVSDSGNHCVKVFDSHGSFLYKFGKYGSRDGEMKFPYGICVDQDENVIVADHYNDRVSLFNIDGTFLEHVVTSDKGLKRPRGVSLRCAYNRKLYITNGGLNASEVVVYRLIPMDTQYQIHLKCEI